MSSINVINEFLESKKFAIAGLSRDPKAFSRVVYKELSDIGYDITPVNPYAEEIEGKKCYKSVDELPKEVDRLLIMTKKNDTDDILTSAINKGMKSVWVQQTCNTKKTMSIAKAHNYKNLVTKQCIFMYANPVSVHRFHRVLKQMFGLMPK